MTTDDPISRSRLHRPAVTAHADGTVTLAFRMLRNEAHFIESSIAAGISALEGERDACADNGDHDAAHLFDLDMDWLKLLERGFARAADEEEAPNDR